MPPALHPRSRLTTSLFTTTLAVCFLVVGAPHILPCPVPARQFTDGDFGEVDENGQPKRRRRRRSSRVAEDSGEEGGVEGKIGREREERGSEGRMRRECPVPKPGGLIGQVLGFPKEEREKVVVKVQSMRPRDLRESQD